MNATATKHINALNAAAASLDWDAFTAAEIAMWDAYHRGIKLDPASLPTEVEAAWRTAQQTLIEKTWKPEYGQDAE